MDAGGGESADLLMLCGGRSSAARGCSLPVGGIKSAGDKGRPTLALLIGRLAGKGR